MKSVAINGTVRTTLGTKFAKQLRREGQVPCVVYGGDQPVHFSAPALSFRDLVYTAEVRRADVELDGKQIQAFVQEIQFHPVTDQVMHIDFIQLVEGKPVTVVAPVKLKGSARGVRNGGRLKNAIRRLKVQGLPEDLPASIEIDITELRIGESVRVADIRTGKFEILSSENAVITSIKTARNIIEDEELAEEEGDEAAAEEGAEGTETAAEGAAAEGGEAKSE